MNAVKFNCPNLPEFISYYIVSGSLIYVDDECYSDRSWVSVFVLDNQFLRIDLLLETLLLYLVILTSDVSPKPSDFIAFTMLKPR